MRRGNAALLILSLLAASCAPTHGANGKPIDPDSVRIYTSIYPNVIDALKPVVDAEVAKTMPGIKVEWVQGGSENIRRRLDREMKQRGGSPGDILLTSDPAFYRQLAAEGKLIAYASPAAAKQPAELVGPDHAWATARFSAMVIGLSSDGAAKHHPHAFKDLAEPHGLRISIGDPDFSGTNLTTVARLSTRWGWDYYRALKKQSAVVAGSNGTVMERLTTNTTDVGVVLLENLLAAKAAGKEVTVVVPTDGAVIIPGPIALLPHASKARGAQAVYDALLSPAVQQAIVEKGFLYSADPDAAPPAGAPAFKKLLGDATLASIYDPVPDVPGVKKQFAEIFAREATADH